MFGFDLDAFPNKQLYSILNIERATQKHVELMQTGESEPSFASGSGSPDDEE